ncbi:MAG: hypothetical protein ACX930_14925 [Erythrobacter sp.]
MIARGVGVGHGWQLILADLALILFLVTLSALANAPSDERAGAMLAPQIAPSQALFRPDHSGPDIEQWLAARPRDPRATLTVFARHTEAGRDAVWAEAQQIAASASGEGFRVRVVVTEGETSDLYASLAYDAP